MKNKVTAQEAEQVLREGVITKDIRNEQTNKRAQMVNFNGFTYCIVKKDGEIINATKGVSLGGFFLFF